MLTVVKYGGPFVLWCWLMRDFLTGLIPVNMDTNTIYGVTKYYFNNLLNGVVPLWEPFVALGRPFYALPICNLYHPATQIVVVLKLIGVNYQIAFIAAMVAYFCLALWGFYLLAKEILLDRRLAYLAYVAFLFSSVGVSMFTQYTLLEILVPAIWFFYGLLVFRRAPSHWAFGVMCLSLMTALGAYLPFYFLTAVLIISGFCFLFYPRQGLNLIRRSALWKWRHKAIVLGWVMVIGITAAPLLIYKSMDSSPDIVAPGRHCQYSSLQECYDRTMNHQGGMLYEEITRSGTLAERLHVGYLVRHQDKISYGSDSLFFVPLIIFVFMAVGFILPATRLACVLYLSGALLILIAVGDVTGVYRLFYDHIFFMPYFRNLFFLGTYLIPLVILLGFLALKQWTQVECSSLTRQKLMSVWIVLVHGTAWFLLSRHEGVLTSAYGTLIVSVAFFLAMTWFKSFRNSAGCAGVLALLVMGHPVELMAGYAHNALVFKSALPHDHVNPVFEWVRPDKPVVPDQRIYQFVPYEDFWYSMAMKSAPAQLGFPQSASRYAFALSKEIGDENLAKYATFKVFLYEGIGKPGKALTGPSPEVDVAHFDVNTVVFKTRLSQPHILVYNDAFTSLWKAYVDGKPVPLNRVNGAFKGVAVPAGDHDVKMSYEPPGGGWVYVLVAVVFCLMLVVVAGLYRWGK